MTVPTRLVLESLMRAPDEPVWGYRICELTGLGSGTVYPILDRLERAGWISGDWEVGQPEGRPRRRCYAVTGAGRAGYGNARAVRGTPAWGFLRPGSAGERT